MPKGGKLHMIIPYFRSSSYNCFSICEMQYFLTYVLGIPSVVGKKAIMGTIVHKVFECMANAKLCHQNGMKSFNDDNLGTIQVDYEYMYGASFVQWLIDKSYDYYVSKSQHHWYPRDKRDCTEWVGNVIREEMFDPRNRHVIAAEPHFDIPIDEPWASYAFDLPNGKKIEGQLSIKGTIDLVTKIDDKCYEIIDWKGLPLDTLIPTPNGWTTMGEISIGDKTFDQHGIQCNVVGKSTVKSKQCYHIMFDDKSNVVCDEDHLWKLCDGCVIDVKDLEIGHKIPITKPIIINDVELSMHPYVLGMWLGDERSQCSDEEVYNKISKTIYGLSTQLRQLGLLHDKHIPKIYLRSSYKQRLDLLYGLMDSHGGVCPCKQQAYFTTKNKRLANDIMELLLSLGQKPKCFELRREISGKYYQIQFIPIDITPFFLTQKKHKISDRCGCEHSNVRKVIQIEKSIIQSTQCIMVDSPDNTYLCTKSMIPTHNSGQRKDWATGGVKDFWKLTHDPQLLIYNYAAKTMYSNVQTLMTIHFVRDGGPFTMAFGEEDRQYTMKMLRKRFEQIATKTRPALKRTDKWFCSRVCYYGKQVMYPVQLNSKTGKPHTICSYIHQKLLTQGINRVILDHTHPGFNIGYYQNPGS